MPPPSDAEPAPAPAPAPAPSALAHPVREVIDLTTDIAPAAAHRPQSTAAHAGGAAGGDAGSIVVLDVIRASARTQRTLGTDYIVSPVRRSVRASGGGGGGGGSLPALLAESGFAYVPNRALGSVTVAGAAGGVAMLGGPRAIAPGVYVDLVATAASTVKRPPRRGVALTPGPLAGAPAATGTGYGCGDCSPPTERVLKFEA